MLLDAYPGAIQAYSVRKLRTAYSGSAIRVRRSSDNSELDIGFTSGNLDTAALLGFVGNGGGDNGFVTTWYDQSGSGNNLTQTTAANQPKIVNAGAVIITNNSRPTFKFDGTNDVLDAASGVTMYNCIAVINPFTAVDYEGFISASGGHIYIRSGGGTNFYGSGASVFPNYNTATYVNNNLTNTFTNSVLNLWLMGNIAPNVNPATLKVGTDPSGAYADMNCSEVIVYGSSQAANRTPINTEINAYYLIY